MAGKTFEYCSLHYLNQWFTYDMGYCKVFADGNENEKLTALKNAGGFYGVARNLPSEYDEGKGLDRYKPVLDIIDPLEPKHFENNTVEKILEVGKRISEKYGNRGVLSLTTKFLWIKIKQPILIYDSQARLALGSDNGVLDDYYRRWFKEFNVHQAEIVEVCSKLPAMKKYAANQEVDIRSIALETWFHERVFDIYLWSKGNNT